MTYNKITPNQITTYARIASALLFLVCYINLEFIQSCVNVLWDFLKTQPWYRTVYNETFFVALWAFPAMRPWRYIAKNRLFESYRIKGTSVLFETFPPKQLLAEAFTYCFPLMMLDTFHVKHYFGVTDEVIKEKRTDWIQITRALPEHPPRVQDMIIHICVALFVYDILFFCQHYTFHKVPYLYKNYHYVHHNHKVINVKVTNRLHVVERMALILSANAGLKMQGAHPLTRSLFIILFVLILLDNHSGYDFPWGYHKILPHGLIAGPTKHHKHHEFGNKYYQPIFTYIDAFIEWKNTKQKCKQK